MKKFNSALIIPVGAALAVVFTFGIMRWLAAHDQPTPQPVRGRVMSDLVETSLLKVDYRFCKFSVYSPSDLRNRHLVGEFLIDTASEPIVTKTATSWEIRFKDRSAPGK